MPTSNLERRLSRCVWNPDVRYGSCTFSMPHRAEPKRSILGSVTADKNHNHTPEEEGKIREAALDATIEDSFPASDPPSSNPNPDDHEAVRRQPRPPRSSEAHRRER